jgi:hypothetical protein
MATVYQILFIKYHSSLKRELFILFYSGGKLSSQGFTKVLTVTSEEALRRGCQLRLSSCQGNLAGITLTFQRKL